MVRLGIYEKALPVTATWEERLQLAKQLGFDFVELSIDESKERLQRLTWDESDKEALRQAMRKVQLPIQSLCLSAHRRYPLGSIDQETRALALSIGKQAIDMAQSLGIRQIQIAGYDVYYEPKSLQTREYYIEGLYQLTQYAASRSVMLSIETMDDTFINSIHQFDAIKKNIPFPWLQVYPDLGNITGFNNDVGQELERGIHEITAIHIKDSYPITATDKGQFRDVPFGEGCVDFTGCFRTLHRLGYDGQFVIEMWSGTHDTAVEDIQQAKAYIIKHMKAGGYHVD